MMRVMTQGTAIPDKARLLAIIELQNAMAASSMPADEVMRIVAQRAGTLTGATGVVVALVGGDDLVYRAVHGSTKSALGMRLSVATHMAGTAVAERKPLRVDDVVKDARADAETK